MKSLPWLRVACSLVFGGLAFCFLWHAPWLRPRAVISNCADDEFAFSSDSQRLAAWSGLAVHASSTVHLNEPGIHLHDTTTGAKLFTFEKSEDLQTVSHLVFSPDGKQAAGFAFPTAWTWDTSTGARTSIAKIANSKPTITRVFYGSDGELLYELYGREHLGISRRFRDGQVHADFRQLVGEAQWTGLELGPLAAYNTTNGGVHVIDRGSGKLVQTFALPEWHLSFYLGTDGKPVASSVPPSGVGEIGLAISPDGQWFVLMDRVVQLTWFERLLERWLQRPRASTRLFVVHASNGVDTSISNGKEAKFSPDGRTLAVSFADGRIELWDFPLRKPTLLIVLLSVLVGVSVYSGSRWWQKRRRALRPAVFVPSVANSASGRETSAAEPHLS